ncbi:nrps5 single domain, non-ribosomal peptide synthase-like protein [Conoideocrella luteorostrata]|uniref:Nrps5 single domain, non-ribosomal peptide synthase-like protein n=1 Tax=Conoideocrella luteorostrata TaxID=1105319 RepID=A0AAJ0D1B1_9HYPO|nr:nrps5 single domain, non-ribosomal peptide synthase-like protein [Conoideocrella luteorostrata]
MAHHQPTLLDHFYVQLRNYPSSVALEDGTQYEDRTTWTTVTYAQLNVLSDVWSKQLSLAGVSQGCIVPILTDRSIAMVAAILAVMKLRAAYVPIDTDSWGNDRIDTVLKTVNPQVIVSTRACSKGSYPRPVVVLDCFDLGDLTATSAIQPKREAKECTDSGIEDLAYIIFTSGTTGKPKGVMIAQRSISSYVKEGGDLPFNFNTTHGTRVLLICSVAFDEAAAKTCHILPLTPSILATLEPQAGFDIVEKIFLGGENPSPALIEAWASPSRRLYNSYGPTETTCTALMGELLPRSPITIGFPISYSTVVLLDKDGLESTEGEICISGLGVAEGYFRDPDRTRTAFVERHGTLIYKTGDYGRHTNDGLQFCGRKDSVVKNRGFLINLEADVEPAVLSFAKVDGAAALMFQDRLIAFVTPSSAKDGLREYLANTVSSFLIPDIVHSLDKFPTTGNGKIDRRSLQSMCELEHGIDANRLETGLEVLEALRRGLAHVLYLPETQIKNTSSFRNLGGNSLTAVMLVSVMRKMGFEVSIAKVLLLDTVDELAATAKLLCDVQSEESPAQENSVRQLRQEISLTRPLGRSTIVPMTDMQLRMLTGNIATPGLSLIKASFTLDHPGKEDLTSVFRAAWTRLTERHEILRTTFILTSSNGAQVISPDVDFSWNKQVVSELEWESTCHREESPNLIDVTDFDPERQRSLSGLKLVTVPGKRTRVIWTVHHSLVDGWSMATLMRDLVSCLHDDPLPAPTQFAQVARKTGQLVDQSSQKAVSFWREYLHGFIPVQRLRFPPPSDVGDYTQATMSQKLTIDQPSLEIAAKCQFSVTPATILYAAWVLLISIYSDSDRVVIGAVLSGRSLPIPDVERIVGPLINTLPLAVDSTEAHSVQLFIQAVFKKLCEVLEYQWCPVSMVQEGCGSNPSELFETLFALQYDFPQLPWQSSKAPVPKDIRYNEATQVPLTVLLDSVDSRFEVRFIYRCSHFEDSIIKRMICHFDNLLSALVAAEPNSELSTVAEQMVVKSEYDPLTASPSDTVRSNKVPETLAYAIDTTIKSCADICAVEGPTQRLTYSELGRMTEHIATYLSHYVQQGSVVCVISDGSLHWLLAMIAVIRAGAIYCPVDRKLPLERKIYMVKNCRAALILYTGSYQDSLCRDIADLSIDSILSENLPGSDVALRRDSPPSGDDVACLIYTSGSTGLPKGMIHSQHVEIRGLFTNELMIAVQLQHKGILNVISQPEGRLHSFPGQRNAQMLSLGFDCCIKEVFSTICYGATLVLKDPENPIAHLANVDAAMATPSLLATLDPAEYPNLKVLTVAGEAVSQALNDKWAAGRTLINGYGPAECTLITTTATLSPGNKVSIGKPLPGMSCYLLDSKGRPVPTGVSGEIYISGVQVTPGYLYNEQETAKRFVVDSFRPGQIMFRTGDIGRLLEDGNIQYIGRDDNQIKLRGFRIDLGEVRSAISKIASEAQSIALIVSNGNLIAFITPETVNTETLATSLASQLPEYAVPNRIVALATLPTSANHKIDSKALEAYLKSQGTLNNVIEDLETDMQRDLAVIWADALGRNLEQMPIGPKDRFFELGGHSLLQIRVAQAISQRWKIRPLPLAQVIRHQVLNNLAVTIEELVSQPMSAAPATPFLAMSPVVRNCHLPVSYLEREMILNHFLSGASQAGNMNFVCKIQGQVHAENLAEAFQLVTANIEVFRTRISVVDGIIHRHLAPAAPAAAEIVRKVQTGDLDSFIHGRVTKSFDLRTEPPVDVSIVIGSPSKITLVVVMSHVVSDAATMAMYLRLVFEAYELLRSNIDMKTAVATSPTKLTYIDWAHWASKPQLNQHILEFWASYLSKPPKPLTFGCSSPRASTYVGHTRSWSLPPSTLHNLSQLATKASVTMHQIVLAAAFFGLQCLDRCHDIVFAAPFTHRTEPGTESIPGLFLDRLLIRVRESPDESSLLNFLAAIRESSQQALSHVIPFHILRSHIAHNPSLVEPLFKVMVTYHTLADQPHRILELEGAEVQPVAWRQTGGSKFPLTIEFTEMETRGLQVDMEYDVGCITEDSALRLEFALSFALQLIVLEMDMGEIIRLTEMSFRPREGTRSTNPDDAGTELRRSDLNMTNTNQADVSTGRQDVIDVILDSIGGVLTYYDASSALQFSGTSNAARTRSEDRPAPPSGSEVSHSQPSAQAASKVSSKVPAVTGNRVSRTWRSGQQEIQNRLDRLEKLLERAISGGTTLSRSPDGENPSIDASTEAYRGDGTANDGATPITRRETLSNDGYDGVLLLEAEGGQSRWVSSLHYALLADEIHDVKMLLGDQAAVVPGGSPLSDQATPPFPFSSTTVDSLGTWAPRSVEDCFALLEIFHSNVDPMTRIVHKPSLRRRFNQYARHTYDAEVQSPQDDETGAPIHIPAIHTFEPMALAIFYSAINSLSAESVVTQFAAQKEALLAQFQKGVELGLGREDFLTTPSIEVLQAFVLLLTCQSREDDMSRTWTLLGLAIRIAQSQGLHREPTLFPSSSMDVVQVETRRRLWHQICHLDFRSAESRGQEPTIADEDYTTLLPRNVDDEHLIEGAQPTVIIDSPPGVTGMTGHLIRLTGIHYFRRIVRSTYRLERKLKSSNDDGTGNLHLVAELQSLFMEVQSMVGEMVRHIETQYLQYCDPQVTHHRMALGLAAVIEWRSWSIFWLRTPKQYREAVVTPEIRQTVLAKSVSLLESLNMMVGDKDAQKFQWHIGGHACFQAIMHIVSELETPEFQAPKHQPLRSRALDVLKQTMDTRGREVASTWNVINRIISNCLAKDAPTMFPLTPFPTIFPANGPAHEVNSPTTTTTQTLSQSLPTSGGPEVASLFPGLSDVGGLDIQSPSTAFDWGFWNFDPTDMGS